MTAPTDLFHKMADAIVVAVKGEVGTWQFRPQPERKGRFTLTWWPEGWMKGRAYWTEIALPQGKWTDDALAFKARVSLMFLKAIRERETHAAP